MTWWKSVIGGALILGASAITVKGLKGSPPPSSDVQMGKVRKGTIVRTVTFEVTPKEAETNATEAAHTAIDALVDGRA